MPLRARVPAAPSFRMLPRAIEFLLLFLVLPAVFAFTRHRVPVIPALWLLAGFCLWALLRDPGFDRSMLWKPEALAPALPGILALFGIVAAAVIAVVRVWLPDLFLNFPRSNPAFWALVMVLYPVASVYPQGIIYRAFLFERYGRVLGSPWPLILASAAAFAWVHIVFRNWPALVLTFFAGILFAARYAQTGSLFVSSFEHALYGCLMFTVGLGRNFYHGAVQR